MNAAETFALALNGKKVGGTWFVNCPLHDDTKPSVSVSVGKDVPLVVRCHAGCDQKAVFDAFRQMGALPAEDAPSRPPARVERQTAAPPPKTLAELAPRYGLTADAFTAYGCVVENGAVRYPTTAPDGKTGTKFKTLARNAGGKRDCRHTPGGAGFFPASSLTGAGVLVVTGGEEKALAGLAAGCRTVTYTAGEGSLKAEAAAFLVNQGNREFIVAMDADAAGRKGAERVAGILRTAGATSVRVCVWPDDAPKGRDLNDILRDEGADALKRFLDAAQDVEREGEGEGEGEADPIEAAKARLAGLKIKRTSSTDLAKADLGELRWTVEGFLPEGLAVLAGASGHGKSWMAIEMALCVAMGRPFLGYRTHKGRVLYIDADTAQRPMKARQKTLGYPDGADGLDFWSNFEEGFQLNAEGMAALDAHRILNPDLRLVILDTGELLIPETRDSNNKDGYRSAYHRTQPISQWARLHGVSVLSIAHTKAGTLGSEPYDFIMSARGIVAGCNAARIVLLREDGELFRLWNQMKEFGTLDLAARRNGVHWEVLGAHGEAGLTDERKELLEWFRANPQSTIKAAGDALGVDRETMAKRIQRAAKGGFLVKNGYGRYSAKDDRNSGNPSFCPTDNKEEGQKDGMDGGYLTRARACEPQDWMAAHEAKVDASPPRGIPADDPEEAAMSAAERAARDTQ